MSEWKFGFGCSLAAPGYTKVTEETDYNEERGFGFTDVSRVTAQDRKNPPQASKKLRSGH
jgi:hypothetical protein